MTVPEEFSRTERLLGAAAMERLAASRVAIFGIGGVGGFVAEALCRSGVGAFDLIDSDRVSRSNLNRQIIALQSTIGQYKTDVMRDRILDINPEARVTVHRCFYLPETEAQFDFAAYDYVIDAVDTVTAKISLVLRAKTAGTPIISCMGAGNKLDPSKFQIADIYETSVCPLARVMRTELRKRGVRKLKVLFSTEPPRKPLPAGETHDVQAQQASKEAHDAQAQQAFKEAHAAQAQQPFGGAKAARGQEPSEEANGRNDSQRRAVPASVAFAPSVAGLLIAAEVVRDLIKC